MTLDPISFRPEALPSSPSPSSAWRSHGKGEHRRARGLHVLRLRGSFREMGEQHGALLRHEIARGPMPYYRSHFTKLIGRSSLGPLAPLVWPALQLLVGRRVGARIPAFARETIEGIAAGAGMRVQDLLDGCTMPDSLLWLASRLMQVHAPGPAVAHRISLGLGCTSAIAWGEATRDGKMLHARNFDYHGVSCWPQEQTVIFHEPDRGQRYVSIASAGVGLGGITAMNESGLSLTVHQHMFTDRARLGGTPIGIVGDVIMREARSIEDAETILASNEPIGCWTYLVTDGKAKDVLCWEENPDRHVAHRPAREGAREGGTFGYANVYLDRELGETEIDLYGSYWRHNEARHRRANQLLLERRGGLDPQAMAEILADPGSSECRLSEAISMVMTVGSVVFRPEDGLVWVGTGSVERGGEGSGIEQRGEAGAGGRVDGEENGRGEGGRGERRAFAQGDPRGRGSRRDEACGASGSLEQVGQAPTSIGAFVPFSLEAADVDARHGDLRTELRETAVSREAFQRYRRAYVAYLDEHDLAKARVELERARELVDEPLYHYLAGLCAIQAGDPEAAVAALSRAIARGHPHEQRRAAFHLWRGRARLLAGQRGEAHDDLRRCLAMRADRAVHEAARRDLVRGWDRRRAARASIDFAMADVAIP